MNVKKTKIMIFGRYRTVQNNLYFTYNDTHIEIVDNYKYLGTFFTKSGSFMYNVKEQYDKAVKAMYSVLSKCKQHNLSLDCQVDMFDRIIQPILLYGCEVWGFTKNALIEKLHMKFCKYILYVNTKTPNSTVYGELGRFPLIINVKVRMIAFWAKMHFSLTLDKLATKTYNLAYTHNFPWVKYIKGIIDECGLSYLWTTQQIHSVAWVKNTVKRILLDQNIQAWKSTVFNSPKCLNYRIYKESIELEKCLLILPRKYAVLLCQFRCNNFKLPIEVGRWNNIPRDQRFCTLCHLHKIGDEYHYIFECSENDVAQARQKFLSKHFISRPNAVKYMQLMCTRNVVVLKKMCKFLTIVKRKLDHLYKN